MAPGFGPRQEPLEAIELGLVHDRSQIRAGERIVAVKPGDLRGHGLDQGGPQLGHHQDVIRGHTGLARIEALTPYQPPGGDGEIGIAQHDRRAFASQFQGYGGEVLGGSGHHQPAHPTTARKKDVIKTLLEQLGCHRPIAGYHLHHLRRKGQGH